VSLFSYGEDILRYVGVVMRCLCKEECFVRIVSYGGYILEYVKVVIRIFLSKSV